MSVGHPGRQWVRLQTTMELMLDAHLITDRGLAR